MIASMHSVECSYLEWKSLRASVQFVTQTPVFPRADGAEQARRADWSPMGPRKAGPMTGSGVIRLNGDKQKGGSRFRLTRLTSQATPPRRSFFIRIGLGRISLLSRIVVNFLHQRLKRAPANLTQVPVVIGHELLAVAGAVHADARPSEVVVGFAETAIADEGRFRSHTGD